MAEPTSAAALHEKKPAICNTCTIRLVRLAYYRAPWFRLVREPLRIGMRAMAAWHRVNPNDYDVRTPSCSNCLRFYKVALKEQSATFRWLNSHVNSVFDTLLERIVSPVEVREAKSYALAATRGTDGQDLGLGKNHSRDHGPAEAPR